MEFPTKGKARSTTTKEVNKRQRRNKQQKTEETNTHTHNDDDETQKMAQVGQAGEVGGGVVSSRGVLGGCCGAAVKTGT